MNPMAQQRVYQVLKNFIAKFESSRNHWQTSGVGLPLSGDADYGESFAVFFGEI